MKLTEAQKAKVRKAVAEIAALAITDDWSEPLKDVDQSSHWPAASAGASGLEVAELENACIDYLPAAAKAVAAQIKKLG